MNELDTLKKPIEKKVFIKRKYSDNEYTKGLKLNGAMFNGTKSVLCAPISSKTKIVVTGLENWSKEDIRAFEEELYLPEGSLKSREFWNDFSITIPARGKFLDLSIPADRLEYIVLSNLPNVAHGTTDVQRINHGKHEAIFVMINSEDEASVKISQREIKKKAYKKFDEMGPEDMKNYLIFIGIHPFNMSDKVICEKAGDEMELNPERFLKTVNNPLFKDVVFIQKCLFHNILTQRGKAIIHGGEVLASTVEGAIAYLNEPSNNSLKLSIVTELEDAERIKDVEEQEKVAVKRGRPTNK